MFKNSIVKIPEKVKFNKRESGIYVYHIYNSSYDSKKGYTVDTRCLIGKKIDEQTMHPNNKYYEIYKVKKVEDKKIEQGSFSDTLSVGDTALIQAISKKINLDECLDKTFSKDDKNMIINLATYQIIEGTSVYQHYPTFAFKHPILGKKVYSDSSIVNFLSTNINDTKIHNFFKTWIEKNNINGEVIVSYDSTNINCESEGIELNEYGAAKEDKEKRIINLSYVFNQNSGTPLFYELYSGSINDMSECKNMLRKANEFGLKHAILIADRGYFSKKNIDNILKVFDGFIIMAKVNNKVVKQVIEECRNNIEYVPNYISNYEVYGMQVEAKLFKDDLDAEKRYFYVYYDRTRATIENENLTQIANKEYKEALKLIGKEERNKKEYSYCEFEIEDNKIKEVKFNQNKFNEDLKLSGYFVIISSLKKDCEEILNEYRNRDTIEKTFKSLKTDLGVNKFGVHTNKNLRSKIFICFVSSIIRNNILKSLESLRINNKKEYTVNAALKNLSRIEASKFDGKCHKVLYSLTKSQKNIIKACGIKLYEINKNYENY